jgi:arylsulfatase A-like enzyme/Tfp pilus assembly protein PilF
LKQNSLFVEARPPRAGHVWKQIILSLAALTLACSSEETNPSTSGSAPGVDSAHRPSAIVVTLDTVRPDRLEPYGGEVLTPSLQRLARQGAVFERAYATTPITLPSHASIFTGLDPPQHGVRNNGSHALAQAATTLAEILRDTGFRTAAFVSAAVLDRRFGLSQGFDTYDDDFSSSSSKEPGAIVERQANATVDAALRWLDHLSENERFFLWIHLFDPHIPYAPPDIYADRFPDRPYDAEIAFADAELGRLLSHPLLGPQDSAITMVIGDHAESLGEHGESTHGMLAYDSTLRIPWIVRAPGFPGGVRPIKAVSQIDLMPTMLELLAIEIPSKVSGRSQASALGSGRAVTPSARGLYAETLVPFYTYGWAKLRTIRRGHWKLIDAPLPELYNLEDDPHERANLHLEAPDKLFEMQRDLRKMSGDDDAEDTLFQNLDRETELKLRRLGYLSSQGPLVSRARRPDPKDLLDVHRRVQDADYHLSRLDFDAAEEQFRAAVARDPDNLAATSGLARALAEQGRFADALVVGQQAVRLAPDDANQLVSLATIEAAHGQTLDALATLESALAIDPISLDAMIAKARLLARLEHRDEAAEVLQNARKIAEGYPRLDIRVAELVELPAGKLVEAEARLRRAVQLEPYLVDGWRILGQVLEKKGQFDAAANAYREGLTFQPRDTTLRENLGLLLVRTGELDPARSHLESTLAERPSAPAYDGLASIANQRGDWERAEEMARRALEMRPALSSGWNNLAIALEEQNRLTAADAAYRRALTEDPTFWQARFNYGLLLRRQQHFARAAEAFLGVLEHRADHSAAHYELGVLYAGPLQDLSAARQHLRACLKADPDHPRVARVRTLLARLAYTKDLPPALGER